jgi:protein ImuA
MGQCLVFPSERAGAVRPVPARAAVVGSLRSEIGALETPRSLHQGRMPLRFGDTRLDDALPWGGLPLASLHEVSGTASATGFVVALAARLPSTGPILWCRPHKSEAGAWYGPGLLPFGLNPERIIFVETHKKQDLLWAMEEGLRSGQPALVVGETESVGLVASRRLQLAAEAGGVTAFLLNAAATQGSASRSAEKAASSVVLTRWAVSSRPRPEIQKAVDGRIQWQAELVHCRGGMPRSWLVEWNYEWTEQPSGPREEGSPGRFAVVAEFSDRQGQPRPAARQVS